MNSAYFRLVWLLTISSYGLAQDTSTSTSTSTSAPAPAELGRTTLSGTRGLPSSNISLPYQSYSTQITLPQQSYSNVLTFTHNASGTTSQTGSSVTVITGSGSPTSTGTTPTVTNSQACNGWTELCSRKYSNITMVAAHNSPFVRAGNAGSNQELDVHQQLDDGVRLLQAQIQFPKNGNEPHFCHTSCDMLDAGPITQWLTRVRDWVDAHPYDVITILLGNGNYSKAELYVPYIEASGITKYVYQPPLQPMKLDDWPTLEWMIQRGKRVVMFLDYVANQTAYPWLMDEFSQMWETPFNPLDNNFPCVVHRPPGLSEDGAKDRLYLLNNNLNVEVSLAGASILIPAVSVLNTTNSASGPGSLGASAAQCRAKWDRAPNFLNVDYYNYGEPPGSVFQVAAAMNNVTYNRVCCGQKPSAASRLSFSGLMVWLLPAILLSLF